MLTQSVGLMAGTYSIIMWNVHLLGFILKINGYIRVLGVEIDVDDDDVPYLSLLVAISLLNTV